MSENKFQVGDELTLERDLNRISAPNPLTNPLEKK